MVGISWHLPQHNPGMLAFTCVERPYEERRTYTVPLTCARFGEGVVLAVPKTEARRRPCYFRRAAG